MNTNKRIRFTEPLIRYRDSKDSAPQELHNARLEAFDIVKGVQRGTVVESPVIYKPIFECGDDLVGFYDDGDLYNGILYTSIKERCGAVVANPCNVDGEREFCPPQITHIATINVAESSGKTFPDGILPGEGTHGIDWDKFVSYIFVPVNYRGEYGIPQYYYFSNAKSLGYPKYAVPTFSIGVSDSVDYVEVYRTLERKIDTGGPIENTYYFFDNFYRSSSDVSSSITERSFYNGFQKTLNRDQFYNCTFFAQGEGEVDISALLDGETYDFLPNQDWDWVSEEPDKFNSMWLRGWSLDDDLIPLSEGTQIRFSNLPDGSRLDENEIYIVGDVHEFRPDIADDICCNCWHYRFTFNTPQGFNYIRDILAGSDSEAYTAYFKFASCTDSTSDCDLSDEEYEALRLRENDPSIITIINAEDPIGIDDDSTGMYVKVNDYNRWNSSVEEITRLTQQHEGEEKEYTTVVRQKIKSQADKLENDKLSINDRREIAEDLRNNITNAEDQLQEFEQEFQVALSALLKDQHLPPPDAITFSSIRKSIAFGLLKEVCINDG